MADREQYWANDEDFSASGVDGNEIDAWEKQYGVALPMSLRAALRQQDGGRVRGAEAYINPLARIVPVDDDFGQHDEFEDDVERDLGLVFELGSDVDGGRFLIDYNAQGPKGSPSVYLFHNDGTGASLVDESIDDFLENLGGTDAEPCVDWSEVERAQEIVARESMSPIFAGFAGSHLEQVLVRQRDVLVLYTREVTPDGEALEKHMLPLPLESEPAFIRGMGPEPHERYGLHLEPNDHGNIVKLSSRREGSGDWDNKELRGAPIYGLFRSASREPLEALRVRIFGESVARSIQAAEQAEAARMVELARMAPADRTRSLMNDFITMRDEAMKQFNAAAGGLPPAPPEVAALNDLLERKIDEGMKRVFGHVEETPPAPDEGNR